MDMLMAVLSCEPGMKLNVNFLDLVFWNCAMSGLHVDYCQ